MSIEAMKLARGIISSINQSKQNALTVNDETVFWQREEWVRWALDEVLPVIDQAIEQAQKQEPVAWPIDGDVANRIADKLCVSYETVQLIARELTSPPQRQPLTEAMIDEFLEDYEMLGEDEQGRDACYAPNENDKALIKDAVFGLLEFADEAAFGIKGEKNV